MEPVECRHLLVTWKTENKKKKRKRIKQKNERTRRQNKKTKTWIVKSNHPIKTKCLK